MKEKIALKRLSHSDLSFFECHFRKIKSKQKAFNLDSAVFIKKFFPNLSESKRYLVSLEIYGPQGFAPHKLSRKILKQQKNWRLNGELIYNPPDEPHRYDCLSPGDYAIISFIGDDEPEIVRTCLICKHSNIDKYLYSVLKDRYEPLLSGRGGSLAIDPDELVQLLNGKNIPVDHPVWNITDFAALEDAVQGGFDGLERLKRHRPYRSVSREEFDKAKKAAEGIGLEGERILYEWLNDLSADGIEYRWDSNENAICAYDFTELKEGVETRRIDAKSTSGLFGNPIHVSLAELKEMAEGDLPYDIYRLVIKDNVAYLRIAKDMREFASKILEALKELPEGVLIDGVSIKPNILGFGDEIVISLEMEGDGK